MPEYYNPNSGYQDPIQGVDVMPPTSGSQGSGGVIYDPNSGYQNPVAGVDVMPPTESGSVTTCPSLDGPITLLILSFNLLTSCQMMWRQGDTQPFIQLQILANGTAVNLSGSVVTLEFIAPGQAGYVQTSTMTVGGDNETCTYNRLPGDYTTVNDGEYEFAVRAVWPDGTGFTAPDNGEALVKVNTAY